MKVLICGSRTWTEWDPIWARMEQLPADTIVVHGGARGVDKIADYIAGRLKLERRQYLAQWGKYGKAAGVIRNRQMIEEEQPDLVIAYWNGTSRGTKDTIDLARKHKIPVEVYTPGSAFAPVE